MYLPAHAEESSSRDEGVLQRCRRPARSARYRRQERAENSSDPFFRIRTIPMGPWPTRRRVRCDRRVLGLMPIPNGARGPQHPRWTRGKAGPVGDGMKLFTNAVDYFSA